MDCCYDAYFPPHQCRHRCPSQSPRRTTTVRNANSNAVVPYRDYGSGILVATSASMDASYGLAGATGSCSEGLDYDSVFLLWQVGSRGKPVHSNERDIPVYVARMVSRESGRQLRDDLAPRSSGTTLGGKQHLNRGWGGGGVRCPDQ